MWRDPIGTLAGALESVFVRLLLFGASIILGGLAGGGGAALVPYQAILPAGYTFYLALLVSLGMLFVLILSESTRTACAALGVNLLAWCWLSTFATAVMSQA